MKQYSSVELRKEYAFDSENNKELIIKNERNTESSKNHATSNKEYPPVSYFELYKFATALDKLLLIIGVLCCALVALFNTIAFVKYGEATASIINFVSTVMNNNNSTDVLMAEERFEAELMGFLISNILIAAGTFISTYLSIALFHYSALRQVHKIRKLFFWKILNQDIGWHDVHQTGDFATRISDDLLKIEDGLGEKAAVLVGYEMIFVFCLILGFVKGWKLTLVAAVLTFPFTTISLATINWITSKLTIIQSKISGEVGIIAEEALTSIRTVVAFGGQEKEEERYDKLLLLSRNVSIKRALVNSTAFGAKWFFRFLSQGLTLWYGVTLVLNERGLPPDQVVYDAGTMLVIYLSVSYSSMYYATTASFLETLGKSRGAAGKIFSVISDEPIINVSKSNGRNPDKINGKIEFRDVQFSYPSRPNVKIFQGLNLTVHPGETVALVGSSGCGKSTCVQLIQRFYDVDGGNVFIDDNDITEFDLTCLRDNIGVVGQEPILFETTIGENIRYGRIEATHEEIESAAMKANAHAFISELPEGYNTLVGERGTQLSGGQKQRIAIARALVRKPSILLLDEATSALDTKSESLVQEALNAASKECTTIIVAHRLSTVKKANRIIVISEGKVQEEGSHDELIAAGGVYYRLVTSQMTLEEDGCNEQAVELINTHDEPSEAQEGDSLLPKNIEKSPEQESRTSKSEQLIEKVDAQTGPLGLIWNILKYNSEEWRRLLLGCLGCIVFSATHSIESVLFGYIIAVLGNANSDYAQNETAKFAIYYLLLGITMGITSTVQVYTFDTAGEKLTTRLRSKMFKTILNQEMAWFDRKSNGVGSLCARLSGEPARVQGLTGQMVSAILNCVIMVIASVGTSLYFEWRVTLVTACFAPPCVIVFYLQQKVATDENSSYTVSLQKSTNIAIEAINGIRTVASFGCEKVFLQRYMAELEPYRKSSKRNLHYRGVVYGLSYCLTWLAYAVGLYYGAYLIKTQKIEFGAVFIATRNVLAANWYLSTVLAFGPNLQKSVVAANKIIKLLQRVPKITNVFAGDIKEKMQYGNIQYENVKFSYPTRPNVNVLKDINLSISSGKTIALVGASGCGKSTIIQLLERFYDPSYGFVKSDNVDIKMTDLTALRFNMGIVSQEPSLFSRTIGENIAYGDNSRTVSMEEIVQAAKKANIHNFIASLPLGYETKLGEKGTQLSGGQKQRVAIARALVRNPDLLLLDEATSALDAESEKVVLEALENAKMGRTSIIIAHRLSTIQDADTIFVINKGKIVEMGTHSELIALKGHYHRLHTIQN